MNEIVNVLKYWRYWTFKAIYRLQLQYKQTLLGLMWEPFSLLFVTISVAFLWSKVLNEGNFVDFFLYVLTGYYLWGLLSSIVQDGVKVFEMHALELTNEKRNLLFYIFEDLTLSLTKFVMVYPLVLIIFSIYGSGYSIYSSFLALFVLFCVVFSAVGFMIIFGAISLFFKDIRQVIQSVMRLAFLLTPIIWRPDRLGEYAQFVWLNPFHVYIQAFREAFLNGQFNILTIVVLLCQSSILFIIGLLLLSNLDKKVRTQAFMS